MLIEAAKGGHTNVVQLLLDYPERCSAGVDGNNVNATTAVAAAAAVATTTAAAAVPAATTTTATATQTCTAPAACVSPEASKMLAPASTYRLRLTRRLSIPFLS